MKRIWRTLIKVVVLLTLTVGSASVLSGCEREKDVGDELEEAAEETGEALEKAGDEAKEAL